MKIADAQDRLLTGYARSLVKFKARQLARQSGFGLSDREDLEQELWLALLSQADRYDPQRASLDTFIDRVVNTAAGMIVRSRSRLKRAPAEGALSLDTTKVPVGGQLREPLARLVSAADLARRTGTVRTDEATLRERAETVAHALDAMPQHMRDVCRLAMNGSISSAARRLKTSRRRIRQVLRSARGYLARAGFDGGEFSDTSARDGICNS